MQSLAFVFFFEFIAAIQASKSRSVNVALETVLEFNNKDDIDFIDTMQNFLTKLKTSIARNKAMVDQDDMHKENNEEEDSKKEFLFTDFLTDTVTVLKSYENKDLIEFFRTLDYEINKWQTRKQLNEVTAKLGVRRLIDRTLKSLRNSSVQEIRRTLNTISDTLNFGKRTNKRGAVGDFLNYFYKKESDSKLLNLLNNLKLYRSRIRRNNIDLQKVIRESILAIIDPLLNLNSDAFNNINMIYYKYIANYTDPTDIEDKIQSINNNRKPIYSRPKKKLHNVASEKKLLDYIEDYKRVIENRFTTKGFGIKAKLRSLAKAFKSTGTTYKYIHTTRLKKTRQLKPKKGRAAKVTTKPHDMGIQKYSEKNIKSTGAANDANDRKPVIIKLANSDEELRSVGEYLSSTSRQRLSQKRFKKSTRRKLPPIKRNRNVKTTKKSRKAFRSTTSSGEGLSIEHFGSLFGKEFHRKSNDNDTFTQSYVSSTVSEFPRDITQVKDRSDDLSTDATKTDNLSRDKADYNTEIYNDTRNLSDNSKEITKKDNISDEKEEYNTKKHNDIKNVSIEVKDNASENKKISDKDDLITESIKIKGNVVIENPTENNSDNKIQTTTSIPFNNFTKYRNFNVSIVTKLFNVQPMKPTIILRSRDMEELNETNIYTPTTSTVLQTTLTSPETTDIREDAVTDRVNLKALEDGLENEIEDIMDKQNATTVPVEFVKYLKEAEMNGDSKKVKDQMQADLAKLLAPPSTKSTVTEVFTDPFNDIDDGADIL